MAHEPAADRGTVSVIVTDVKDRWWNTGSREEEISWFYERLAKALESPDHEQHSIC